MALRCVNKQMEARHQRGRTCLHMVDTGTRKNFYYSGGSNTAQPLRFKTTRPSDTKTLTIFTTDGEGTGTVLSGVWWLLRPVNLFIIQTSLHFLSFIWCTHASLFLSLFLCWCSDVQDVETLPSHLPNHKLSCRSRIQELDALKRPALRLKTPSAAVSREGRGLEGLRWRFKLNEQQPVTDKAESGCESEYLYVWVCVVQSQQHLLPRKPILTSRQAITLWMNRV